MVKSHPTLRDRYEREWPVRVLISTTLTNIKTNAKRSKHRNYLIYYINNPGPPESRDSSSEDEGGGESQNASPRDGASGSHEAQFGTQNRAIISELWYTANILEFGVSIHRHVKTRTCRSVITMHAMTKVCIVYVNIGCSF